MLRIGHIGYANCTPIFHFLKNDFDCSRYIFLKGVPSRLNKLLLKGELDISPSSSIEFARHDGKYLFLPDLSISSRGKVGSIILFTKVPLERLDGERIAITKASATSSFLLKIIMIEFLKMKNIFYEDSRGLKDVLKENNAFMLIGDDALKAVQGSPPFDSPLGKGGSRGVTNSELYSYDLGELWHRFTKLPFVFALWLVRAESLRKKRREIEELGRRLLSAKERAYRGYRRIAEKAEEREWIEEDMLIDYWKKISYDLGDAHLEGLRMFYRYSKKLSLIKRIPSLEEGIIPLAI